MSDGDCETFSLEEVFEAYYSCRRTKRTKESALAFEVDLEANLIELWRELNSGAWKPGPSVVFIVEQPVKREVFAAGFRDRVVHHVLLTRFIRQCSAIYTRDAWVLKLDIRGFFMHISRPLLMDLLESFMARCYPNLSGIPGSRKLRGSPPDARRGRRLPLLDQFLPRHPWTQRLVAVPGRDPAQQALALVEAALRAY